MRAHACTTILLTFTFYIYNHTLQLYLLARKWLLVTSCFTYRIASILPRPPYQIITQIAINSRANPIIPNLKTLMILLVVIMAVIRNPLLFKIRMEEYLDISPSPSQIPIQNHPISVSSPILYKEDI